MLGKIAMSEYEIKLSGKAEVWKQHGIIGLAFRDDLTLRELLACFRRHDRMKAKISENLEVDSAISEVDSSEISVFVGEQCDTDSGISVGETVLQTPKKALFLREKQKRDRETILKKLSMTEPGVDDDLKLEKSWSRSYSSSSHLHICYINYSSEDSDGDEDKHHHDSSPFITPSSPGTRSCGRYYNGRVSDSSSVSSTTLPDSAIIQRTHQETRPARSKQEELEIEARYQLARAYEKAKALAAQKKLEEKSENNLSLAHRLLSSSLSDETSLKMKEYSLSWTDCRMMTRGQLQLLLNDMHARKQALNHQLMALLISREEYRIEQDAKLSDVGDLKSAMLEIGPETTV